MAKLNSRNTLHRHRTILHNHFNQLVMEIKVLGPGCTKCKTAYSVVEKVIRDNNVNATLSKVDDIIEMMQYNIMSTPAIVVDGVVRIKGKTIAFLAFCLLPCVLFFLFVFFPVLHARTSYWFAFEV